MHFINRCQYTKLYPFQNLSLVFILKISQIQFQYPYKIYSYRKKKRKRECGASKITVSAKIDPIIPPTLPPQIYGPPLNLFIRTLWCHYTTCFDRHCYGLFYRDGSDPIITQIMDMLWYNYLEVFLWPFQCKQLAVGMQHRLPTNRWFYCFLLMPYGVSMKLFKKPFPNGWRIFSPPNAVSSKRFLSLTKNRSFEHGGYAPPQNEYTRSAAGWMVDVKLKARRIRAPFSP